MVNLTKREKEILSILKEQPLISQQEVAEVLGITRSSVAVHIANLMKKGYVKGKGYIITEEEYVTVIGGTNIDIQGFPHGILRLQDSNPGEVTMSLGGVGRNIAENLVKLNIETKLITAMGNDIYGRKIVEECKQIGIDMDSSLILKNRPTSIYLSILDENRDMKAAISHMDIIRELSIDIIKDKAGTIKNSKIIVLDTNLDGKTIEYILGAFKGVDFFLDTVSTKKAEKVRKVIGSFHTIKPNKIESEVLSGIPINSEKDIKNNIKFFLDKGVKKVFITVGKEGVYYGDNSKIGHMKLPEDIKVVNTTGAGDAFVAGLVYSYLNEFNIERSARFAMGASILALSHVNTINPNMTVENLRKTMKELK